jgi:hypothetical protein
MDNTSLPISLPYPIPYHLSRYTYVLLEKKLSLPASIHPNTPLQSSNHPTSHPTSHVMSCHVMPCHVKPALVPPYSVASTYLPTFLPYPIPYHLSRYTYVLLEKKLSLPASIHPNTPLQSSNHPTSHPTSHVMSCHVMPCHVKPALVPPYSVASTYLPTFLPYPHTYQGT